MPNCTTYHNDKGRTGWFRGTRRGVADASRWRKHLDVNLGFAVRGAPLLLEGWKITEGPHKGETYDLLFVTTSANLVNAYAIEQLLAGVAAPLWSTQLPPASLRTGSNIPPPVGVCSTPVIDETAGTLHVLAMQGAKKFTSGETSPKAPALCTHNGNLYIAWKGDGNDNLNVAQVQISGNNITGFTNKVTLGDTSPVSPTLASLHGRLYLGWKGDGNDNLNVMYSADNGQTFGHKITSLETSPQAPCLCAHNGNLYMAWKGDGNDQLNVAVVRIVGNQIVGLGSKVTLDDTSPVSPALASLDGQLFIGWKGDGNDNLNVMGMPDYHVNVLDVNTGQVLSTTVLADHGAAGRPTFNGILQDQRGALNLVGGWVYASFADFLAFDAGDYHGWVVGWEARHPPHQRFFATTRTVIGGGAWGPGGPAAAGDDTLYVATGNGGTDNSYWQNLDGGNELGNKFTSGETSPRAPALCGHNGKLLIGWKGDSNDNLNVAEVQVAGHKVTGFANKVTLGDTSPQNPALASLHGRLYLAWKGDGNDNLNVMYSADDGQTFGHKFTSPETSPHAPGLCAHNGSLYITWKGDGNDNLNVAQVQIAGNNITGFTNKVTLGDTSPLSPTLASAHGRLYLGWKGDGNDNLNVMYSADNGTTFGNKLIFSETSPQAPGLCSHEGNIFLTWKGDGNDNLNVAQVLLSENSIVGDDKVTLSDTSPLTPSLASLHGRLYTAWKGDGNDNLNVMCLTSPGEVGDFQESVVRLRADAGRGLALSDWYTPLNAQVLDQNDQDIGGSSVMVLPPINGVEMVLVTGKDGNVYLLNRLKMGHWGGALWREQVYNSESKCGPAHFQNSSNEHHVFVIGGGQPGLVAYKVVTNNGEASLHQLWQATGGGINLGDFPGSPAVQSFPDWQDAMVWIVDDTIPALRGFRESNGSEAYNSSNRPSDQLPGIAHFPPITCASTGVFVGTGSGFSVYAP